MSLRLRSVQVTNFRKFRDTFSVEGMTDALNIVIEPNEAGKSTLLEALRAVFFVRHGTKNQLVQSFVPHGENVAPSVEVVFELDGAEWRLTKRFLKSPNVELRGPAGRVQGDEAEEKLQELLGFERDTSRSGSAEARGILGLLWVGQTDALEVTAPGSIVRNSVRGTLEAEVGAITGGAVYDAVRSRIDQQFALYWTPSGQVGGRQREARARADEARQSADQAAQHLAALESTFSQLEASRAKLKVLRREVEDDADQIERAALTESLQSARGAAQILATRIAESEAESAKALQFEGLQTRHKAATEAREVAQGKLAEVQNQRAELAVELNGAKAAEEDARAALAEARTKDQQAREALNSAQLHAEAAKRAQAISTALDRYKQLVAYEGEKAESQAVAATLIPAEEIEKLEANEREIAEAKAELAAGATTIELIGTTSSVSLDGQPLGPGKRTLTGETRLNLGDEAELIIRPPSTLSGAEARLATATSKHASDLVRLDVESLGAARARNEKAREASAAVRTLTAKIDAVTMADDVLGLEAGPAALKAFASSADAKPIPEANPLADISELRRNAEDAESALGSAQGIHEARLAELQSLEGQDQPLAIAGAGAMSDLDNANDRVSEIESMPGFADLDRRVAELRQRAADAAVALEEAKRNALAHDADAIKRKIERLDSRSTATAAALRELETNIARLQAVAENEGGKGLGERTMLASEEADAAERLYQRVSNDAQVTKLLRDTLEEARKEASQTYVGPVAARAKKYIERLLPGCDLSFSEDLGLRTVHRGAMEEDCDNLSRGTQEQLAVLTRLAFAEMLLDEGYPVSLILDDPLVYADDSRLDLMTEILADAANRMQVILLTCRDRAFRHVEGNRLAIQA
jgi:chromosome segregation ATPase